MSVGTGGLIKKGAGDLVFKGNGSFELGNIQVDYSADKAQGITATGESPNNAVTGTLLADGRLVIGTKGDDSDAPYVTTAHHITLGGRTTDWNSWANGVCENARRTGTAGRTASARRPASSSSTTASSTCGPLSGWATTAA